MANEKQNPEHEFSFSCNSEALHTYASLFRLLAILGVIGSLAIYNIGLIDLYTLIAIALCTVIPLFGLGAALAGLGNLQDMQRESVYWEKKQADYLKLLCKGNMLEVEADEEDEA